MVREVASETNTWANVIRIDVDAQRDLAAQFGIRGIPTCIVLKDGEEIDRFHGAPKSVLISKLQAAR